MIRSASIEIDESRVLAARVASACILASILAAPGVAWASPDARPQGAAERVPDDDTDAPVAMRVDLPMRSVTLYRGRASVTRAATQALRQGLYELRVGPLPESADLDSVQAKVAAPGRILDVKTETVALPAPSSDNPRVREALASLEAARAALAEVVRRIANNAAAQKTIDSIAARVAADASGALGGELDPEKLRAQLSFIGSERDRLTTEQLVLATSRKSAEGLLAACERALADAGGAPPAERYALVTLVAPNDGEVPVEVTYLVSNATWTPSYVVRGDLDRGTLALEFEAVVRQATGEDWRDVALLLSTAQPTRAANPGDVPPAYLELFVPPPPPISAVAMPSAAPGSPEAAYGFNAARALDSPAELALEGGEMLRAKKLAGLAADADVGGSGPAVEFRLPRTFSAASDAAAERRTRVAAIDATPSFALVARPLVEDDVYLRARFRNESPYVLLPGEARMYLGSDSIGRVALAETPVGGEVELWFGKEPRVRVKRELVSKAAGTSGVFSKASEVARSYRIELVNTMTRAADVEVWDRVPVSRDEQVKVELKDVSPALSTDAKYLKDQRPQGILMWTLPLPPRAEGADARPVAITWRTRTSWPQDQRVIGDVD